MSELKTDLQIAINLIGKQKLNLLATGLGKGVNQADKLAKSFQKLEAMEKRIARLHSKLAPPAAKLNAAAHATDKLERSANRLDKTMMRGSRSAHTLGGSFTRLLTVGSKLALVGYAARSMVRMIGGAIGGAMKPILGFEAAMAQVQIKGGKAFSQPGVMRGLAESAKQIGRTTTFAPVDAAQAQIELAASNLTPGQIKDNLPTILKFAQASGMETQESAGFLLNVANQFGMSLDDPKSLMRVGNAIKAGADASTIDEREMQHTMRYAGTIASQAGQDVTQVSAMAAILGNKGVKSSQAGTGLRNMYAALVKPKGGKRTAAMLDELGMDTGDLHAGLSNVPKLLEVMNQRIGKAGWGSAKQLAFVYSMFGQYGATAAKILMDSTKEVDDSNRNLLERMTDDIRSQTTALDDAAKLRENTLEGRLAKVTARWQTLWITVGEKLLPHVSTALDSVISKIEQWEAAASSDPEAANAFTAIGLAIELMAKSLEIANPILKGTVDLLSKVVELKTAIAQSDTEPSDEQKKRAAEAAGIPAFGPGIPEGATAGDVTNPNYAPGQAQTLSDLWGGSTAGSRAAANDRLAGKMKSLLYDQDVSRRPQGQFPYAGDSSTLVPYRYPDVPASNKPSEVVITVEAKEGSKAVVSRIKKGNQPLRTNTSLAP
jgi:TP901 family phage tail tape measure protein